MCALDQRSLIGRKAGSIKLRKSSSSVSVITRILPKVIGDRVGADVSSARTLIVGENEKAEHRRQVRWLTSLPDLRDEACASSAFGNRDLLDRIPKCVLQADTSTAPRNDDRPFYN
jgi:hypothetical protein